MNLFVYAKLKIENNLIKMSSVDDFSFFLKCLEFAPSREDDEDIEDQNNDLALAYANRSAIWNDRGEHALAIRDADLAFAAHYPEKLQHKLYERKGQCFMAMGKYSKARAMLETSIELLTKSTSLKGERLKAKEKDLKKILQG